MKIVLYTITAERNDKRVTLNFVDRGIAVGTAAALRDNGFAIVGQQLEGTAVETAVDLAVVRAFMLT